MDTACANKNVALLHCPLFASFALLSPSLWLAAQGSRPWTLPAPTRT